MTKTDRRAAKRQKARYGHTGAGSVHTRQSSEAEVRGAIRRHAEKSKRSSRKNF